MGEGYNEARKKGMEKEIEAYNGDLGEKMKNAYSMVGAYEAEMENQYQQSIINAMQDATKRIEEEGLTGIEAEKVMWEAKHNQESIVTRWIVGQDHRFLEKLRPSLYLRDGEPMTMRMVV